MHITKISVHNFRSIREADIIVNKFSILIGMNNHGKSNVFEAIQWFYSGKGDLNQLKHCDASRNEVVSVELEISVTDNDLENISNEDNRTKIKNIIGEQRLMKVRRISSNVGNREIYHPDKKQWNKQPTGTDSAFNNCIPRFEFIVATKNLKEVSAYRSNTPIAQMLSGVLGEVLGKDDEYYKFQQQFEKLFHSNESKVRFELNKLSSKVKKHLAKQFPDCKNVSFNVTEPSFDDLLKKYSTNLDDGVDTLAEDKGDGMQRALMLAIIKTYADYRRKEALGRSFIFFIDEAELHLHPTGQRLLKDALLDLCSGVDQVFITTHSSVFIADECEKQKIFKVEKVDKNTSIQQIEGDSRVQIVFDLLGGSPSDILLPANFLIVEGHSDSLFLNKICKRFYKDKPEVLFLAAGGDFDAQSKSMDGILKAFMPLHLTPVYKERLAILCDKPTTSERERNFNQFKHNYNYLETNGQLFVLDVGSLEEAYPERWKKKSEEVSNMSYHDKRILAEEVANEITQQQFENDMETIKQALDFVWEKSYIL